MADLDARAGTARWLAEAATLFGTRILEELETGPESGAEALLGCLPTARARQLLQSIDGDRTGPGPARGSEGGDAALDRLADPDRLPRPIAHLLATFHLPIGLAPACALLLVGELDDRFTALFGWLNDDAQRRHLTAGLLARLAHSPVPGHELAAETGPLVGHRLVEVTPLPGQALPDRAIRFRDPLVRWLLSGRDHPELDPSLDGLHRTLPPVGIDDLFDRNRGLDLAAQAGHRRVVLVGDPASGTTATAVALAATAGRRALVLDGPTLGDQWPERVRIAHRDASLRGETLAVTGVDHLRPALLAAALDRSPAPVILTATHPVDVGGTTVPVPELDDGRARHVWRALLGPGRAGPADELAHRFRLPPEEMLAVAVTVTSDADGNGDLGDLSAACLHRSTTGLDRLATRIPIRRGWDDLVLPPRQTAQLGALAGRVAHANRVYEDWGFGHKVAPDRGLTALFSGPSGVGKTLSAEILAGEIGLPLYRVDLASTVSKYIGETEKNLEAIFAAAEAGNACLFFDECDALFGKRSEVNDAHDRYANIETSYLLQRLERHRGIVMLASNHPQNIDEAFTRRIDVTIEFPLPDAASRARLWSRLLPEQAEADIDAEALGGRFELSGGSIRNCLLSAAFLAAAEDSPISDLHCIRAVAEEYQKTGRPMTRSEFGEAFPALRTMTGG